MPQPNELSAEEIKEQVSSMPTSERLQPSPWYRTPEPQTPAPSPVTTPGAPRAQQERRSSFSFMRPVQEPTNSEQQQEKNQRAPSPN